MRHLVLLVIWDLIETILLLSAYLLASLLAFKKLCNQKIIDTFGFRCGCCSESTFIRRQANPRAKDPVPVGVHTHRARVKQGDYSIGYTCNPAFSIALNYEVTKVEHYWHLIIHSTLFLTLVPLCYFGIMFIYVLLHK